MEMIYFGIITDKEAKDLIKIRIIDNLKFAAKGTSDQNEISY